MTVIADFEGGSLAPFAQTSGDPADLTVVASPAIGSHALQFGPGIAVAEATFSPLAPSVLRFHLHIASPNACGYCDIYIRDGAQTQPFSIGIYGDDWDGSHCNAAVIWLNAANYVESGFLALDAWHQIDLIIDWVAQTVAITVSDLGGTQLWQSPAQAFDDSASQIDTLEIIGVGDLITLDGIEADPGGGPTTNIALGAQLTHRVTRPAHLGAVLAHRLHAPAADLSAAIAHHIERPRSDLSAPLAHRVAASAIALGAPLRHEVADLSGQVLVGDWQPVIEIDGQSRSVTGTIQVRRRVGEAGTVEAAIIGRLGDAEIGADLHVGIRVAGQTHRLYTGELVSTAWLAERGESRLRGAERLAETLRGLPSAQIDALIPAPYSAEVYGEPADGWDYARQRLRGSQHDIAVDRYGAVQLHAWSTLPIVVPLAPGGLLIDSLQPSPGERGDAPNTVRCIVEYRYSRAWQRERAWGWHYGQPYCEAVQANLSIPTRQMILGAAAATGWQLSHANIQPPQGGAPWISAFGERLGMQFECGEPGSPQFVLIRQAAYDELAYSATLRMVRAWQQRLTERMVVTVRDPARVAADGEVLIETRTAIDEPYQLPVETPGASDVIRASASIAASGSVSYGAVAGSVPEFGSLDPASGDRYEDQDALRDRYADAVRARVAEAAVTILGAQRRAHTLRLQLPGCLPWIELGDGVHVVHPDLPDGQSIDSIGQVIEITHTLAQAPITELVITTVLPPSPGAMASPPAVSWSNAPADLTVAGPVTAAATSAHGGYPDTGPDNPDREGYTGNRNPPLGPTWAERIAVRMPDIEAGAVDPREHETAVQYVIHSEIQP